MLVLDSIGEQIPVFGGMTSKCTIWTFYCFINSVYVCKYKEWWG